MKEERSGAPGYPARLSVSVGTGAESVRSGGVELPEDVLEETLKRLSVRDKAFVLDVLNGKRWAELGMTKRTFNWKIKAEAHGAVGRGLHEAG